MTEIKQEENKVLTIEEIFQYLPHRYPFLLVDRVVDFEVDKSILAYKNVTIGDNYFLGHFPQKPVMPGVLIVEALAQTAGILAYKSSKWQSALYYLASIENTRFKKVVSPGDRLYLQVEFLKVRASVCKFVGKAIVDDEVVCTSEMTCIVGNK